MYDGKIIGLPVSVRPRDQDRHGGGQPTSLLASPAPTCLPLPLPTSHAEGKGDQSLVQWLTQLSGESCTLLPSCRASLASLAWGTAATGLLQLTHLPVSFFTPGGHHAHVLQVGNAARACAGCRLCHAPFGDAWLSTFMATWPRHAALFRHLSRLNHCTSPPLLHTQTWNPTGLSRVLWECFLISARGL